MRKPGGNGINYKTFRSKANTFIEKLKEIVFSSLEINSKSRTKLRKYNTYTHTCLHLLSWICEHTGYDVRESQTK